MWQTLPQRVAAVLESYKGPVAAMSFDPRQVAALRDFSPDLRRGLVAMRPDQPRERNFPPGSGARFMLHALAARLSFLAYRVQDLPSALPSFARNVLGLPLLTWTVRTPADRARAERHADQIIFEGWRP